MTRCQQRSAQAVEGGRKWKKKERKNNKSDSAEPQKVMPWERAGPGLEKFWFPFEKGNLQPQGKKGKTIPAPVNATGCQCQSWLVGASIPATQPHRQPGQQRLSCWIQAVTDKVFASAARPLSTETDSWHRGTPRAILFTGCGCNNSEHKKIFVAKAGLEGPTLCKNSLCQVFLT